MTAAFDQKFQTLTDAAKKAAQASQSEIEALKKKVKDASGSHADNEEATREASATAQKLNGEIAALEKKLSDRETRLSMFQTKFETETSEKDATYAALKQQMDAEVLALKTKISSLSGSSSSDMAKILEDHELQLKNLKTELEGKLVSEAKHRATFNEKMLAEQKERDAEIARLKTNGSSASADMMVSPPPSIWWNQEFIARCPLVHACVWPLYSHRIYQASLDDKSKEIAGMSKLMGKEKLKFKALQMTAEAQRKELGKQLDVAESQLQRSQADNTAQRRYGAELESNIHIAVELLMEQSNMREEFTDWDRVDEVYDKLHGTETDAKKKKLARTQKKIDSENKRKTNMVMAAMRRQSQGGLMGQGHLSRSRRDSATARIWNSDRKSQFIAFAKQHGESVGGSLLSSDSLNRGDSFFKKGPEAERYKQEHPGSAPGSSEASSRPTSRPPISRGGTQAALDGVEERGADRRFRGTMPEPKEEKEKRERHGFDSLSTDQYMETNVLREGAKKDLKNRMGIMDQDQMSDAEANNKLRAALERDVDQSGKDYADTMKEGMLSPKATPKGSPRAANGDKGGGRGDGPAGELGETTADVPAQAQQQLQQQAEAVAGEAVAEQAAVPAPISAVEEASASEPVVEQVKQQEPAQAPAVEQQQQEQPQPEQQQQQQQEGQQQAQQQAEQAPAQAPAVEQQQQQQQQAQQAPVLEAGEAQPTLWDEAKAESRGGDAPVAEQEQQSGPTLWEEAKTETKADTPGQVAAAPPVEGAPAAAAQGAPAVAAQGAPAVAAQGAPAVAAQGAPAVAPQSAPAVAVQGAPAVLGAPTSASASPGAPASAASPVPSTASSPVHAASATSAAPSTATTPAASASNTPIPSPMHAANTSAPALTAPIPRGVTIITEHINETLKLATEAVGMKHSLQVLKQEEKDLDPSKTKRELHTKQGQVEDELADVTEHLEEYAIDVILNAMEVAGQVVKGDAHNVEEVQEVLQESLNSADLKDVSLTLARLELRPESRQVALWSMVALEQALAQKDNVAELASMAHEVQVSLGAAAFWNCDEQDYSKMSYTFC